MTLKQTETTQFMAHLSPPGEMQPVQVSWDNEQSLQLLLETAPLAILMVDQAGRILFANRKLEEMFDYHRAELISQNVELLLPEHFRQAHVEHRANYIACPQARPMGAGRDLSARRKDGTEFPVEVGLSFIKHQDELLIMGSIIDISLRKRSEELLEQRVRERTHELERRRQVASGLRDILAILNSDRSVDDILHYTVIQASNLLGANASAIYRLDHQEQFLTLQSSHGLPAQYIVKAEIPPDERMIGQVILTRQPIATPDITAVPTEEDEAQDRRQTLLDSGYYASLAVPLLIKDEIYGALVLYYSHSRAFSDEELDLAVTFADQAALAVENARLRAQVERAAVAAERSRLARDLHDAVTQTLFSASLIAEVLPRLWERDLDEAQRRLEELRQLTRGALAEMRTLLLELRPSRLIEVTLSDLLHQLAEAVSGRTRIPIKVEIDGQCNILPEVQVALYRTAQEALNNIAKHARASQATVRLRCRPKRVELSISDDGRGFRTKSITPDHFGLSIMRERAEATGAKLEIKSQVGQGTQVLVVWEEKE
jgi:PAS domain S-box-containing protein